jgi:integrase
MYRTKVQRFPGVFFRESEQRRHNGKPDRCYDICFKDAQGKLIWEKVGWASEGYTSATAAQLRAERVRMVRHGEELPNKKKKEPTFAEAWEKYYEWAKGNRKSHDSDLGRYKSHLKTTLGPMRLGEISPFFLEKLKIDMTKRGLSPQSTKHTLALVRQVFNKCKAWDIYSGENPVAKIRLPSTNHTNRQRFLSAAEADLLLEEVSKHSVQLYEICLLALHSGMRAGEIFNLRWGDVLPDHGIIHILDAKNGRSRQACMTTAVKQIFTSRLSGAPKDLVFVSQWGQQIKSVSGTFDKVVQRLGFNNGVEDRRQKVVFHSLRHTFGSWLAMAGAHPRTIMELMGHSRLEQTMRYSHLAADQKQQAIADLERMLQRSAGENASEAVKTKTG